MDISITVSGFAMNKVSNDVSAVDFKRQLEIYNQETSFSDDKISELKEAINKNIKYLNKSDILPLNNISAKIKVLLIPESSQLASRIDALVVNLKDGKEVKDLPIEILQKILLDVDSIFIKRRVNKAFKDAIEDKCFLFNYLIANINRLNKKEILFLSIKNKDLITVVNFQLDPKLDQKSEITDDDLKLLGENCPNIETLAFSASNDFTDAGYAELAKFPKLKSLAVKRFCDIGKKGENAIANASQLEELSITGIDAGLTDRTLDQIVDNNPGRIKKFHLFGSNDVSAESLYDALPKFSNLEDLHIKFIQQSVNDDLLIALKSNKQLKNLSLDSLWSRISNVGLQSLTTCSNLENIQLSGNKQIDDEGLKILSSLKNLKTLNLTRTSITKAGILEFPQPHVNIKI